MLDALGRAGTRRAAQRAYDLAGIGPEDIDVAEVHDCFVSNEMISCASLGFCEEDAIGDFVLRGENTYGGKVVVCPSGGLLSKGHPLGATGLAQITELTWQLRGEAGERQVEGARTALAAQRRSGQRAVGGDPAVLLDPVIELRCVTPGPRWQHTQGCRVADSFARAPGPRRSRKGHRKRPEKLLELYDGEVLPVLPARAGGPDRARSRRRHLSGPEEGYAVQGSAQGPRREDPPFRSCTTPTRARASARHCANLRFRTCCAMWGKAPERWWSGCRRVFACA